MKNNRVYNRSVELGIAIISFYNSLKLQLPDIASQLLRSATSIGANIAEAQSAESTKDFIHKLSIALKEARETYFWLEVLSKSKPSHEISKAFEMSNEICALLTSTIKTLQSKRPNS